jgi:outer membrane protein OmpA-like peptidoglycan-associated protein
MTIAGCASAPKDDPKLEKARAELKSLQENKAVQAYAPAPLLDAEQALKRAENAHEERDKTTRDHQYYLAKRSMETAEAITATNMVQQETKAIGQERERLAIAGREAQIEKQRSELEQAQARSRELESELSALEAKRTDRGMLLTLDDVFFETAGANIKSGASRTLDKVVAFMKSNPDQEIIVEGHTDSLGTASFNQRLSEQRAEAVKQQIVARGVEPDRVDTQGYGESRPVASNESQGGRQLNRRVEIIFPDNNQ